MTAPPARHEAPRARPAPLQAVRGMNDVLPDEAALWLRLEDAARQVFALYGYRNLRVPVVEPTALFVRGIGEHTDVVEKEMYSFDDRLSGESLTLRPEATAGIVRAAIEHSLCYERPQRVWLAGPMFRHERPQKGRYRQFHQFDVEALGFPGPDVDAEQIVMLARLWRELGLSDGIRLAINSIGDAHERRAHRAALVEHFERHRDVLDEDARRRLHANPLRILDSKTPAMQAMIAEAPRLVDGLSTESRAHFDGLAQALTDAGVAFEVNPRLVRGLDYYNRTVFEWITERLGAQGTVAGGGRYDGLFEALGGKPTPACGFAIGVERMILLLQHAGTAADGEPLAYVMHSGDAAGALALRVAESLRDAGHAAVVNAGGGSFKSQMKKADASGARYALIVGESEAAARTVAIKPLRDPGEQRAVPAQDIVNALTPAPPARGAD
ncbi:histidyl-tRNA synthetase [Burkholderiales bacterium]|nr:histidyl-tRNA synthetase [Burkholderiales bacterium]